jgi:Lipocalin-like domain
LAAPTLEEGAVAPGSLIGVWKLVRYCTFYEGEPEIYPLGRDATGYIQYTPDGYMFGVMSSAHREPFAVADRLRATPDEKARAFDDYVTYCGRYRIQGDSVFHRIEMSLLPNWIGEEQERRMEWRDGKLALIGEWTVAGRRRVAVVEWERP